MKNSFFHKDWSNVILQVNICEFKRRWEYFEKIVLKIFDSFAPLLRKFPFFESKATVFHH